ncbi:MAG: CopG family transcriptional regulator [Enterococcus sp.]|nr:CopG family transcriptional regulator [Enterococcus sp.]
MAVSYNKKRIMISLTMEQNKRLEEMAASKGFSKSAIIALALEEYSRKEFEQKK